MVVSIGPYIFAFGFIILSFCLLFFVSWLIHHFSKKESKPHIFKIAIIIWLVIFAINFIATLLNIPIVIGFNYTPSLDGGVNGKYVSLGYVIEIEGHNLIGESNYDVHFTSIF